MRKLSLKEKYSILFLSIFYIVGMIGIASDIHPAFLSLTPLILLISTIHLVINHKGNLTKLGYFLLISAFIGYLFEVVGVKTGWIFGEYSYGNTLGFKVMDVPPVIGLNWAMLTYATGVIINYLVKRPVYFKSILAMLLMILLDLIIEPVAHTFDFWHWKEGNIPIQNFIAWGAISWILLMIFYRLVGNEKNPLAIILFVLQILFFAFLNLINLT